jgi:tRNA (adenine22-N1)-methyltransferase
MNPSSKLGPRLNAILELVIKEQKNKPYPCIWDCCCDHGYLGIKILSENLCDKLIFVDQMPHIIEQLTTRIEPFSTGKHELIAMDAGELCFDSQQRHLVILAGVGGEVMVKIVSSIESKHPDAQIDYIFCPSASQKFLREYLSSQKLGLVSESLACENKRYYEILFVKGKLEASQFPDVSLTCDMWDFDDPDHQRYLKKINEPRVSKKPARKIKKKPDADSVA